MAATYRKVSTHIPSAERTATITSVVAGDQIIVSDILGRPARRVKIIPDDSTDSIAIRINNRLRIPTYYPAGGFGESGHQKPTAQYVVSEGAHQPLYTLTGSTEYLTEEGVEVSFIQIDAITFGAGGTDITIYVW